MDVYCRFHKRNLRVLIALARFSVSGDDEKSGRAENGGGLKGKKTRDPVIPPTCKRKTGSRVKMSQESVSRHALTLPIQITSTNKTCCCCRQSH